MRRAVIKQVVLAVLLAYQGKAQHRMLNYYRDIQPIILSNCASCHRPGQSAPFPLLTYADVSKRTAMIKYVTETGYMPPWKADTTYSRFVDERLLAPEDAAAIAEWISQGAPAGDPDEAVGFSAAGAASNLGKPDLVLTAPQTFTVPGINQDTFAYFVMHYTLPSDTNVLAFEFSPGDPLAVHHSNTWVFPEPSEYDRVYEANPTEIIPSPVLLPPEIPTPEQLLISPRPLVTTSGADAFSYPDFFPKVPPLYYDGWVPGATARTWPQGFGFKLPARGVVIMQIHYGPSPVERHDRSSVNVFFTAHPVSRVIESFNIGTGGGIAEPEPPLLLPADSVMKFAISAYVSYDQSYIALNPHMHYLGKEMTAYAVPPSGDTIRLVRIPRWDFRWQEFYKPLHPIKIPAGSLLRVEATYDNTADNPENRYNPPVVIKGGANSTDEMMSLIVMSVSYEPGDEQIQLRTDAPVVVRAATQNQ